MTRYRSVQDQHLLLERHSACCGREIWGDTRREKEGGDDVRDAKRTRARGIRRRNTMTTIISRRLQYQKPEKTSTSGQNINLPM